MMEKGKESEFPEGRGGGKGEPGVPPISYNIRNDSRQWNWWFDRIYFISTFTNDFKSARL
jgi:hypothetical protein